MNNHSISIKRRLRQMRYHRYRFIHYILPELLAGAAMFAFILLLPILAAFVS